MDKIMYIVRGLPGSGKTMLANKLTSSDLVFEADQFFMVGGEYKFDPKKLPEAHAWCQARVRAACELGKSPLVVSNTSTRKWEYEPYVNTAREFGYAVIELIVRSEFESVHNVPASTLAKMKENFEF